MVDQPEEILVDRLSVNNDESNNTTIKKKTPLTKEQCRIIGVLLPALFIN